MSKPRKVSVEDKLDIVQLYLNQRISISQLAAKQYTSSQTTIKRWLRPEKDAHAGHLLSSYPNRTRAYGLGKSTN